MDAGSWLHISTRHPAATTLCCGQLFAAAGFGQPFAADVFGQQLAAAGFGQLQFLGSSNLLAWLFWALEGRNRGP